MNRCFCVFASFLVTASAPGQSINYRVSTFAGTSVFRDAVQATEAFLKDPRALVYDRSGNLYIADSGGHLVRRVSPTGASTVVAGNGVPGSSGDLGPAKSARLVNPNGLALDVDGNLFISDSGTHQIRRVAVDGTITTVAGTTVAGTGTFGFSGDGGPATSAALNTPLGLAVDAGRNLLICDSGNGRIRRVTPSGVISTIAGTGAAGSAGDGGPATAAQLSSPRGIAIDSDSSIYIAEFGGNRIRKIDSSGTITTFAGNGTAQSLADGVRPTSISSPIAVAATGGIIHFIEYNSNRVRSVNSSGLLTTVAGTRYGFRGDGNSVTAAAIAFPSGIAVTGSTVVIADTENNRVRAIQDGTIRTMAGRDGATGDGGLASQATFNGPVYLASQPDGTIAVSDRNNFRIRAISPTGVIQTVVGTGEPGFAVSSPTPTATLRSVEGLAYANPATTLSFSNYTFNSILTSFTSTGTPSVLFTSLQVGNSSGVSGFAGDGGPASSSSVRLNGPAGLVYDARNSLYIADQRNHRIRLSSNVSTPRGTLSTFAGNGTAAFSGDRGPAALAALNSPSDVALAPNGDVLIADQGNGRIRRVDAAGNISTIAGGGADSGDFIPATTAKLTAPSYVSADAQGNVYFSDRSRIRVVTTNGTLYTIAGTGLSGFAGDGGLGTAATFYQPSKMIVDAKGNVFVADYLNDRIRLLTPLNPSTLKITSGDGQTGASGSKAAQLLTVLVAAADGTPLPNCPVTFKVESGPATLAGASARTLADGTAVVTVTFGATAGPVIISGSSGTLTPVRFNLTASASVVAKLEAAAGDRQFAVVNTALPNPLTVRALDATGLPIPGLAIAWRVASGTATLSEATNTTQADGSASVKVTLGDTPGPVIVTANGGPVAAQFSLMVLAPAPEITPDSLMGAGQSDTPVRTASPLGLMTFRAARLLPFGAVPKVAGADDLVDGKLPLSFLGVCVDVNGIRAPLTAIEADNVQFQVPPLGEATQAKVVLVRDCGQPFELRSNPVTIDAAAQAPELFMAGRTAENQPRVLALGPDGVALTAATPESTVSLMATGLGFTNPALAPGESSVAELPLASPVTVSIAGQEVPAEAVSVPGAPGRYAVRIKLRAGLPNVVEITVTVNAVTSPVALLPIAN